MKYMNQGSIGNNDSSQSVGDWDDVDASSWTVRGKKGITEEFPPDTYDIPNPIRSTRETKGPSLSQENFMKEWINNKIQKITCKCGLSCKGMWMAIALLGILIMLVSFV